MRISKWFVAAILTFSFCSASKISAQAKSAAKQAVLAHPQPAQKPKANSPLDSVIDALYAAHTFEQAAISPDGKKIA